MSAKSKPNLQKFTKNEKKQFYTQCIKIRIKRYVLRLGIGSTY